MTSALLEKPSASTSRKIIVAKAAGYCFGVRRAVQMAQQARSEGAGGVVMLGKLIHNPQEIARLKAQGIETVARLEEVSGETVVLSAHGVPPSVSRRAKEQGLTLVDTTCPFVTKVHRAAVKLFQEGYQVMLLGDRGHTEVIGITGAVEEAGGTLQVVSAPEEIAELRLSKKVGVLSQTTQTAASFGAVVAAISVRAQEVKAINTICGATDELQSAAVELARRCEIVLVVGGKMSANTRRLRDLCEAEGVPAYHIETPDEIEENWLSRRTCIGVTAGASTPDWLIEAVVLSLNGGVLPENWLLNHPDS